MHELINIISNTMNYKFCSEIINKDQHNFKISIRKDLEMIQIISLRESFWTKAWRAHWMWVQTLS